MTTVDPVIVLGTGRCGSTLMSKLFREHPEILSVSEYFSSVVDFDSCTTEYFGMDNPTGAEFWEQTAIVGPRMNTLSRLGTEPPEYVYQFRTGQTEFNERTGIPSIMLSCLSFFEGDPDELFHALAAAFQDQPRRSVRGHQDWMFQWLMQRFGKRIWLERSGAAVVLLPHILQQYPDVRFLNIVRDGRDTALSMHEHSSFRIFMIASQLTQMLGYDPFRTDDRSGIDKLPPEMQALLPENLTPEIFGAAAPPIEVMGKLWSDMIVATFQALGQMPADRAKTFSYEQLCANPHGTLSEALGFLGVSADADWLARVTATIRKSPSTWQSDLTPAQCAALEEACAPGMAVIADYLKV